MTLPILCPIVRRGVRLRAHCVSCAGTPPGGMQLAKGDLLYRQGDEARHVFAVTGGWLQVFVTTPDGKHAAARFVGPGDVIGLEALSPKTPTYLATTTALRTSRACAVSPTEMRTWFQENPDDAMALTALGVEDLATLQRRMVMNASLGADERVLELVKDFAARAQPGTWVELPATREQLGAVLGLTFETVSRALHRLADRGLIAVDGRRVRLEDGR